MLQFGLARNKETCVILKPKISDKRNKHPLQKGSPHFELGPPFYLRKLNKRPGANSGIYGNTFSVIRVCKFKILHQKDRNSGHFIG